MDSLLKAGAVMALGLLICQMCGCASSRLVDTWHDPSFQTSPLGKMLVIAVRKDATKRRIWEDAFAGELVTHGIAAIPSYSLFPDAPPDTNQVIATVQANGFDGVVVILRLPTKTNTHYVQGYITTERNMHYRPYWQRYWTYYREIEHPGYIDTQKVAMNAVDVTTTGNNGHMIWSATSKTPDPGSMTGVQKEIAGLVAASLVKRRIIGGKR